MTDLTDRLALPLLATGQAQKELTHNEAITRLSFATQASVVAIAPSTVPSAPSPGQCWVVGASAAGAWAGKDAQLACWTANGWRFIVPFDGFTVWSIADGKYASFTSFAWSVGIVEAVQVNVGGVQVVGARQAAITSPSGGSTIDAEARSAVTTILGALRTHGLIEA